MTFSTQYLREIRLRRDAVPSFDRYPFSLNAVRHLDRLHLHPAVTYVIGENGSGKSTLLEAIAVAWGFNPEGGSRHFSFETYRSHSDLHRCLGLIRGAAVPRDGYFLRAESFFNVASEIERMDAIETQEQPKVIETYGCVSLHEQSHGESFFALFNHRFKGRGLYLLDEPEAALSPTRQMAMLARMHQLVEARSQFVIATHSPIVMAYPGAWIYHIGEEGLERIEYEETEHVRLTRDFLNHSERFLDELLDRGEVDGSFD